MRLGGSIRRVCVIGSGIAGLGAAACLKQLSVDGDGKLEEVVVFESRENFLQAKLGGGIQLSGGSAVLERIGCLPDLVKSAEVMHTVLSRNSNGDELIKLDVDRLIRERAPKELCADGGKGDPMIYTIMRDALLSILYNATTELKSSKSSNTNSCNVVIKNNKRAISVTEDSKTDKLTVQFADGSKEEDFDLVIGADGISSTVKNFTAYGDETVLSFLPPLPIPSQPATPLESTLNDDSKKPVDSKYTGIRITYCVTPPSSADLDSSSLRTGAL